MSAHGGEIREGFLCPMCMKDLGTVSQLQSHFEEAHSTEDKATLNQLRGNIILLTYTVNSLNFNGMNKEHFRGFLNIMDSLFYHKVKCK
jgi:hypothetical protein